MRSFSIFILFITLCAGRAFAKEPASFSTKARPLTVEHSSSAILSVQDAITAALRQNPELRVFEASVGASKGAATMARTLANPELTLAPGVKRTRDAGVTTSMFHGEIELSQLFKFPGKRALEIAIAQSNVALQQLALEGFRFQVIAKVRKAFYEMLAAQKVVALRKEQVDSAKTFLASAQKRAETGYASDFEAIKSHAEVIAASHAMYEAQREVMEARLSLNLLMGQGPQALLEVTGELDDVSPAGGRNDYLALALAQHPSLRAQTARADLAGLTLRATRFGRRPDFAVGPKLEYAETEQIYGVGVTIGLPIWDQKRGEIETATGEQRKALAEMEKTRAEIAGEVTKAVAGLQNAKESAALYTPEFLRQLRSFVVQADQGYTQNATTLIIYLDAKRTYFDTLSSYYEALGKVAASRAELESAVGVPLDRSQR